MGPSCRWESVVRVVPSHRCRAEVEMMEGSVITPFYEYGNWNRIMGLR